MFDVPLLLCSDLMVESCPFLSNSVRLSQPNLLSYFSAIFVKGRK